jgi:hypothetical protein
MVVFTAIIAVSAFYGLAIQMTVEMRSRRESRRVEERAMMSEIESRRAEESETLMRIIRVWNSEEFIKAR